jgi:hypothetical protein
MRFYGEEARNLSIRKVDVRGIDCQVWVFRSWQDMRMGWEKEAG